MRNGMNDARTTILATAIVIATGAFWGVYWIPVRALDGFGLTGAWGTAAIAFAAAIAFGIGGRDLAADSLKRGTEQLESGA